MVDETLLGLICCPACAEGESNKLVYHRDIWLICHNCDRKYPVVDGVPVMLIQVGDQWIEVAKTDLPVPYTSLESIKLE